MDILIFLIVAIAAIIAYIIFRDEINGIMRGIGIYRGVVASRRDAPAQRGLSKWWYLIAIIIIILIIVVPNCITTIPAGNVGIKDTFGSVPDDTFQPGIYLKGPFTTVVPMSVKSQKYIDYGSGDTATITALSNEGLSVTMGIAVVYHLNPLKSAEIYRSVGTAYEAVVMVNPIHAVPRDIISKYDAKTLYSASMTGSTDRAKIEQELYDGITKGINAVGVKDSIVIEQVSIRNIDLPQTLKDAIAAKLQMEQAIAQKRFEVEKQDMESNRMRSEAQGIADANKIISGSLTQNYLEWYWIESMQKNPKVIYVPVGQNGMPLIKQVGEG